MTDEVLRLLQGVALVVAALFPIVNPLGNAPAFLALTDDQSNAQRLALARKVALNGFVLLLVAIFVGDYVLAFFAVSIPVVQIAGGLVVASLGWGRLNDSGQAPKPTTDEPSEAKAFYPLTLPMTVGPGAISVAITIGANFPSTVQPFLMDATSAVIGAFIVCTMTWIAFSFAERVTRKLGPGGLAVVIRLSAFILLCIGVQIMWNGIDTLFGFTKLLHPAAP
ncbi:MAG: MarC family protein [Casimicrobiaceae bacterium]